MRLITVVQARMTSTRLPGKVLQTVGGRTLLEWVLYRLSLGGGGDPVIVATSVHPSDDRIADLCDRLGTVYYRGQLGDVLDRYQTLAHRFHADAVLRVTADCPLLSPVLLDTVRDTFRQGGFDYVGGHPLIADGLCQEIIGAVALEDAWRHAGGPDREHVVTYTLNRPDLYRVELVRHPGAESKQRFSVDSAADLERLRQLHGHRPDLFDLDVPELVQIADA